MSTPAAAGILIGDGHAGAIYKATGPERLSGAERAALIAEINGRPLAFVVTTEKQLRAGLTQAGLPVGVVNTVISIQASFAARALAAGARETLQKPVMSADMAGCLARALRGARVARA